MIRKHGVVHLLKKGLAVDQAHFQLMYPAPLASSSQKIKDRFKQNIFSVTRQLRYSKANPLQEIDIVVFVNGIPIITFELKNEWTGQNARYHGQKQYKQDRDITQPLLSFARCIVHMAVDTDEVYMTTKLAGANTFFLPFNKGHNAGAGNPPCIVDETADLVKAAEDIINGASFDYNLPCIAEKSLIVVDAVAERLVQQMQSFGAMLLNSEEVDKLRAVCLPEGIANKKLVGKSPATLLEAAGIPVPAKAPRLLTGIVKADDPWVTSEQLMPMLPVVTVSDFDSALTLALEVEEGLHHTAIMHSQNVSRLNLAARTLQTSIFVKNGPSYAGIGVGGEGFTTFTIATPTGEGTTSARTFARSRRCVLTNGFSIR